MGKLLIANNPEKFNKLDGLFGESHFVPAWRNGKICVYKKLKAESYNYREFKNGDYICAAGTLFYKGKFGLDALTDFYEDFDIRSIQKALDDAFGSFGVVIKKHGKIRVFTDSLATYFLYYYISSPDFIITNTYYHIKEAYPCEFLPANFAAIAVRGGVNLGKITPYRHIYRLLPNEYLEMDENFLTCHVGRFERRESPLNFASRDECVRYLYDKMSFYEKTYARFLPRQLFFLTGGVDSRLEVAAHSHCGNPDCRAGYWLGNDIITNGTKNDWECCQEIAEKLGIQSELFDVSVDFQTCLQGIDPDFCGKYGEYASVYGANKKWFAIFESITDIDAVNFGYVGEILRPLGQVDAIERFPISLDKFISDVFLRTGIAPRLLDAPGMNDVIYHELVSSFGGHEALSKDEAVNLFDMTRLSADCRLPNLLNSFCYSYTLLGQREFYRVMRSAPYEWKDHDYIPLALLRKFNPGLLDVKFFSHHHYMDYDSANGTLVDSQSSRRKNSVKKAITALGLHGLYVKFLKKYVNKRSRFDNVIFAECLKCMEASDLLNAKGPVIHHLDSPKDIDVDQLATLTALLKVSETKNERLRY